MENLKALVYGRELTDYQRGLAQKEFEKLANQLEPEVDVKIAKIKVNRGNDGYWLIMGDNEEIVIHLDKVFPKNGGLITNKAREWIKSKRSDT